MHPRNAWFPVALAMCLVAWVTSPSRAQEGAPKVGPDAACAAKCQTEYDRDVRIASALLSKKGYYFAMGSNNCGPDWDTPQNNRCSQNWNQCAAPCGPYADACKAPCSAAFQTCCHATETRNADHRRAVCLAACPAARPRLMGCVQPAPSEGGGASGAPGPEAPWTTLLKQMNAMMSSLGPGVEGLNLQQFDNVRRNLVFMQVSTDLKASGRKFAVVSGGSGRLWVVLANGRSFLVDHDVTLDSQLFDVVAKQTGLTHDDVLSFRNTLVDAGNKGVSKPGNVFYFPEDSIRCWQLGSSEHSSVRGTINGGGDFI